MLPRRLSSVPPPKRKDRIPAKDVERGDEIMVYGGNYSRVTDVQRSAQVTIRTASGEVARMSPDTMVAVKR